MIPGSINALLLGEEAGGAAAYSISRSLRFNSSDSAYLSRTPASAGNRKTWTWAGWVKRSGLGSTQRIFSSSNSTNTEGFYCELVSGDTLTLYDYSDPTIFWQKTTSQVFRDASAWFHLQVTFDSTNATAGDRVKLYVNGVLVTAFSTSSNPSLNYDSYWNAARDHAIGRTGASNAGYFSGYLADIHFIDGQALNPSSFVETSATTGQLIPKAYTGSFGTNGFWLKFSDNSAATATTLGKDYSGNGNNWTPNNLSVTAGAGNDSLVDTPTSYGTDTGAGGEVRGNYATLNPLKKGSNITLTNGNLDASTTLGSGSVHNTIGVSSGKWYWECTLISGSNFMLGIAKGEAAITEYTGQNANSWSYYSANGNKYTNNSTSSYSATYTANDVIGVALDADNGTLTFYKNGVSQGQAYSGLTSGPYFASCSDAGGGSSANSAVFNFGQRPFAYTAPSGFKALCDTNLPAPTIARPSTVMDVKLYTGNGSTQTVSGLGFSPDLVWLRNRSQASNWVQFDTVRGALNRLCSNLTVAEASLANSLTSFDSTGFTYGSEGSGNNNGDAFAAFCWDAGTSTVTNTQGSITSQVRANASAGFSIVAWTPQSGSGTVGHGLNVAPEFIITKDRDAATEWFTYHKSLGAQNYLVLNLTNGITSNSTVFSTIPTSTVFDQGTGFTSGNGYGRQICYCFAPVAGYSSFGSYTGNGSADGPFVFTGFRPRWILIKNASSAVDWELVDTARDTSNGPQNNRLQPNSSAAEAAGYTLFDTLSNGFKVRSSTSNWNGNTNTIIYAAFAENPFQYARAR